MPAIEVKRPPFGGWLSGASRLAKRAFGASYKIWRAKRAELSN